jgi:hypothetical protein
LKKGIEPDYLINLDRTTQLFYKASYTLEIEEEKEKIKAILGKG